METKMRRLDSSESGRSFGIARRAADDRALENHTVSANLQHAKKREASEKHAACQDIMKGNGSTESVYLGALVGSTSCGMLLSKSTNRFPMGATTMAGSPAA